MPEIGEMKLKAPLSARVGEPFEIKTVIRHPNHNGIAKDMATGKVIPEHYIKSLDVTFDGAPVYRFEFSAALSENPYLNLSMRIDRSGELELKWIDSTGAGYSKKHSIEATK